MTPDINTCPAIGRLGAYGVAEMNASGLGATTGVLSPSAVMLEPRSSQARDTLVRDDYTQSGQTNRANDTSALDGDPTLEESPQTQIRDLEGDRKMRVKKIGKRMGFILGSLNVRGQRDSEKNSKYKDIATLVRKKGILILSTQETKMKEDEEKEIMQANKKIEVINNYGGRSGGIGFVINKDLMNEEQETEEGRWEHEVLIEGRASRLRVEWSKEQTIDIINVYFPNQLTEKISMAEKLLEKIEKIKDWKNPYLMGDYNFVEETVDRSPERRDDHRLIKTMEKIRKKLKVVDGWRTANENERAYTYEQAQSGSKSRIDRIYITKEMYQWSFKWGIETSAGISDHKLVTVEMLKQNLPYIGKGMWRMSQTTIESKVFQKRIRKLLIEIEGRIEKANRTNGSIQAIWKETKMEIQRIAKEETKNRMKQLTERERKTEKDMEKLMKRTREGEIDGETRKKVRELERRMGKEEKERIKKMQKITKVNFKEKGEKNNKYFYGLAKIKNPKTIIMAMRDKNDRITTNTKEMTKIASKYHEELQKKPERDESSEKAIEEMLKHIQVKLEQRERDILDGDFNEEETIETLKETDNGVSPGIDGIPFEFYKHWREVEKQENTAVRNEKKKRETPKIGKILAEVFKDIERNGVKETTFNLGTMVLIYKKGDKTKIENYRPVTMTNTDYKLMTKTIATRLGKIVGKVIHEDQAGFIPGRSLYDSVRLTSTIIDYCEQYEINGCIISLDQEKAYDKIAHDWLWKVLEKFGFSQKFIDLIKKIYEGARTIVMVNGVLPVAIEILRGVRQGDPMSCLLYNLAIEPLACAIRKSGIKGIKTPGMIERIIASLFADDTLVYVTEKDTVGKLNDAIEKFCKASTAKFNMNKTVYMPIGKEEYRKKVIEERKINDKRGGKIPEGITIVKDRESMRTLGAWVGNKTNQTQQWRKIIETQKTVLKPWADMRLSLRGKELILKAHVQSRAIFLSMVNGMPKEVEKEMNNTMKNFLWEGKRALMKWEDVTKPREQGGLGIPDIRTRNEAIQIIWLQKFLAPTNKKPKWAMLTELILKRNVAKNPKIEQNSMTKWGLQKWNESAAKWSKIPQYIKSMIKVARKYNIGVDAPRMSVDIKRQAPVWHHLAVKENYLWNKKSAKEIREERQINTVGELEGIINDKRVRSKHRKIANQILGLIPKKMNPTEGNTEDEQDHTPRRIRINKEIDYKKQPRLFDPNVTEDGKIEACIRIFNKEKRYKSRNNNDATLEIRPAKKKRQNGVRKNEVEIYTDGSCSRNGDEKASAGCGIWHKRNSKMNKSIKITGGEMSSQRAEIIAISEAALIRRDIIIKSDSQTVVEGILMRVKEWEDIDYSGVQYEKDWRLLMNRLRKRKWTTRIQWIKGHDGIEGNEGADGLAKKAAESEIGQNGVIGESEKTIDERFEWRGARLQKLKQDTAYKLLISQKRQPPGTITTRKNIERIKDEVENAFGMRPNEKNIWMGIARGIIPYKIGDFIWKIIHNRIKCGRFFARLPGKKERAYCVCGQIESIEHILLYCEKGVRRVWEHVEETWDRSTRETKWIEPSLGTIMGVGAIQIGKGEGEEKGTKAITEKYKEIVAETIWMIWKNRNERVMQGEEISESKMIGRWNNMLKEKIGIDWEIAKRAPQGQRERMMGDMKQKWGEKEYIAEIDPERQRICVFV